MSDDIRRERTLGATADLDPQKRHQLRVLRTSEGWPALLDVMEQFCITVDTQLINVPVGDDAQIIAMHTKAQVAWQMFERVQGEVTRQAHLNAEVYSEQRPTLTPQQQEQQWIERTLNPVQRDG